MASCDKKTTEKLDWSAESDEEYMVDKPSSNQPAEPSKPPVKPRRDKKSTVVKPQAEPRRTVVTEPPAKPRQRRDQKSTEPKKEGQCPFCAFATHSNPEDFPEELKACCCMWCPKSKGKRHGERCEGIKS
jgi:hypothetical protein